ncbi:MAG: carbohydrate-binding family 9-like protein [Verrucomicrobia bacterium]|nr:carbohydrate-binding family 9-like protein [Verrucomicrobiota bacterium]
MHLAAIAKKGAPLVKTAARALWSPDYLYLGFDCEETKMANLKIAGRNRDEPDLWKDSDVEIFLNPSGDRANYDQFIVNAKGAVADVAYHKGGVPPVDWSWNCAMQVATKIGTDGWTAELAIPLMAVAPEGVKAGMEFVANFFRARNLRDVPAEENELYSWSPIPSGGFDRTEYFGRIRFVDRL